MTQIQEQQQTNADDIYYSNFVNALKSKTTKTDYTTRLSYFMDFLHVKREEYAELVINKDKKWIENNIKNFLVYLRNDRKISYKSASHYLDAIKKFYYVNSDYEFKWSLIKMYLGDDDDDNTESFAMPSEEDCPYKRSEIQAMLKSGTDIRVKITILLQSSAGMRVGAIPLLKIRNLTKIDNYNLYQINVYDRSKKSSYITFCTPECASMIDSYLNYRRHCGETLKPESPLLREQFNPSDKFKVNNPRHIKTGLIKYLVNEVLTKYSALKQKIDYDYEKKRKKGKNSTMLTHAFRKYFDTEARKAGMYPDFVELLMGHKLQGVRSHYFKPDTETLFEGTQDCKGYLHAINDLTINDENRLSKQVHQLKEKDDYQNYVIDKKMKEKDEQINALQESIKFLSDTVNRALLADSTNKIITAPESDGKMIVKGIELKPEINHKTVGQVKLIPSDKKK